MRTTLGEEEVDQAVGLMKLVKDKETLLLELLDTICERFPSDPLDPDDEDFTPDEVKVTCSRHGDHLVHPAGFRLLEQAEAKMGTALQEVVYCRIEDLWKFQDELSERVRRQQGPILELYSFGGKLKFNIGAFNLLKRCQSWLVTTIVGLKFEEDWMGLGSLLRMGNGHIGQIERVEDLDVHSVRSARKRDLQTVWRGTSFELSDVYSKEEKTFAEGGFREIFFHRKQQQDLERNPGRREVKLTEEELLVIFGGLHE